LFLELLPSLSCIAVMFSPICFILRTYPVLGVQHRKSYSDCPVLAVLGLLRVLRKAKIDFHETYCENTKTKIFVLTLLLVVQYFSISPVCALLSLD
jgi:hypothetical protein